MTVLTIIPIFFIGFSVAWYAVRAEELLRRKEASRLQRFLGYVFIWWALSTLKDLVTYIPAFDPDAILLHVYYIDGCGAITFAVIFMELVKPGWVTLRKVLYMLIPFLLFFGLHLVAGSQLLDAAFTFFFVAFAFAALVTAIVSTPGYERDIRDSYSNLEDVDISWMWLIIGLFTAIQLIWWAVSRKNDVWADSFYYLSSLICWHLTMRNINRMRTYRLAEHASEGVATYKRYTANLDGKLEQLMEQEQLYLNPDLTLADLVQRLGTNRTYLSDYISRQLGTTFYDYVNRLRIERRVIPMMKSHENYTLEHMAEQAGFKSVATFRRAFKKLTGILPSEYMLGTREKQ